MERPGWHPEDHTFIPIQSQSSSNPNRTSASDPAINTTSRPRLDASFIPNHTPKAGYGPLPSRPGGSSEFTPSSAKSADSSSSFDSVGSLAPPDPNAPPPVYPRHSRQHQHQHQRSRSQVWSSSPNSDRHTNRTPQPGESQSQNQYRQQPQHRRNRSVDAPARDKDRGEEKQWGADRNEDNKLDRQSVLHRASTTQLPHHLGSKEDSSAPPSNIRRIVSTTKPVPKARVMSNANLWCDACRKPISGEGVEWMVCELCVLVASIVS